MKQFGMELALTQELRMTPQLILNLKLLPLTTLELDQLIRHELESNPVLELSDEEDGGEASDAAEPQPEADPPSEERTLESNEAKAEAQDGLNTSVPDDYSINDLLPDDGYARPMDVSGAGEDDVAGVELAAGPEQGLREALLPELRGVLGEEDGRTAEILIEWLDEDGLLDADPAEVAGTIGVHVDRVNAILHVMQRIPPGGIGCRDARCALLVQLELAGYGPDSLERKLLADHWELIQKKQTGRIAKLCGVTEDDVRQAIGRLLVLEPKPARRFTGASPAYVAPDFSVEWQGDRLVAVPTDERLPRLRLSRKYQDILRHPQGVPAEQLEFARKKFNAAVMFLRAIESRRRTVKNLVDLVINEQHAFFAHGPEHLRPATLRRAADRLGVHPSTLSRASAGKYIETAYGIFPLKYFFRSGAGDKSRTSIKERLRAIIDAEDKSCPLSDDELCAKLNAEGVDVRRRTVAKYRAELGIAGCAERKSF